MLAAVDVGQPREHLLAVRGEVYEDFAGVKLRSRAADKSSCFEPVDQADAGVVPDLKRLGEFADRRRFAFARKPANREQKLMLLGEMPASRAASSLK